MRRRTIQHARALAAEVAVAVVDRPARAEPPISDLRERRGLSVEELAAELGIKPGALALIERLGSPPGTDWQLQDFSNYRPLPVRGTLEVFVPTD